MTLCAAREPRVDAGVARERRHALRDRVGHQRAAHRERALLGIPEPRRGHVGFAGRGAVATQHERRAIGGGHVEDRLERGIRQRLQVARAGQHLRDAVQRLEMALRALQERQRRQRRRRRRQPVDLGRLDALAHDRLASCCRLGDHPSPCRRAATRAGIAILEHRRADANQVARAAPSPTSTGRSLTNVPFADSRSVTSSAVAAHGERAVAARHRLVVDVDLALRDAADRHRRAVDERVDERGSADGNLNSRRPWL